MKMIVGLGNPGPKYETTRHNVGFLAIDRLIDRWKATGPSKKHQGEVYQTEFKGEKIYLVKPLTFMNLSGKCIGPLFSFYQCPPNDLLVIHDELALSPMTLRLKTGGGTGGHNGLKSVQECIGKENLQYHRLRIGIGHPTTSGDCPQMSPADYVLSPFEDIELEKLDSFLNTVAESIEEMFKNGIQSAMNKFHSIK